MAFPNGPGLTPPEIAFLCEMELVTVVPRQRLERLDLLGVSGPAPGLFTTERWEHPKKAVYALLLM
jgi:GINS complex subunit 2